MEKKQIKAYSEAYDKLYDLNSMVYYKFDNALEQLEKEAKREGYIFKLNERTQKMK